MTLLLAMIRSTDALLLSDRRVSRGGQLLDDEFNKVTVLFCTDARLAIAFTGVATQGEFVTSDWLASTLGRLASREASCTEILERLRTTIGMKMREMPSDNNRLTVLCVGWVYWTPTPEPRIYEISNVGHDGSTLEEAQLATYSPSQEEVPIVQIAGQSHTIPEGTVMRLLELLRKPLPATDVLRFAVTHLRIAAKSRGSGNSIGEQCNAVVVQQRTNAAVVSTYHSSKKSHKAFSAGIVVAGRGAVLGMEMIGPNVLAGPSIRPKDPCWCGSGTQFARCHLKKFGSIYEKFPPFKAPLPMFFKYSPERPWLSGTDFLVSSSFA